MRVPTLTTDIIALYHCTINGFLVLAGRGGRMAEVTQTPFDARQERILDAAAALVLRHGYTHTSTGAIAARANVSKATLYEYWPGKLQLFHVLVVRESLRVIDTWVARIRADPRGGGIGPLCAHGFRALATSPLLRALYTSDIA